MGSIPPTSDYDPPYWIPPGFTLADDDLFDFIRVVQSGGADVIGEKPTPEWESSSQYSVYVSFTEEEVFAMPFAQAFEYDGTASTETFSPWSGVGVVGATFQLDIYDSLYECVATRYTALDVRRGEDFHPGEILVPKYNINFVNDQYMGAMYFKIISMSLSREPEYI